MLEKPFLCDNMDMQQYLINEIPMPQSPQIKKISGLADFAPHPAKPKPKTFARQTASPAAQPKTSPLLVPGTVQPRLVAPAPQPALPQPAETGPNPFSSKKILYTWEAKEYEQLVRPQSWYIGVFIFFFAMVAYALFEDNLLMGILFILFGLAIYLFEKKQPRTFNFQVTPDGVIVHTHLYEFDSLDSFWIFYEPSGKKTLSLKSKKKYLPFIHIPIGQTNPVELRQVLLDYLPEEKQEEGLLDAIERFF